MGARNSYGRGKRGGRGNHRRSREERQRECEGNRAFYDFYRSIRDDGHAIDSPDHIGTTVPHEKPNNADTAKGHNE